jgi:hypothetical protein
MTATAITGKAPEKRYGIGKPEQPEPDWDD